MVRADGVEGLEVDEERVIGEEALMYDETEAELVLRIEEEDLMEEYCEYDTEERVTELLLAGLEETLLSTRVVDSLDGLLVETDLVAELLLGAVKDC